MICRPATQQWLVFARVQAATRRQIDQSPVRPWAGSSTAMLRQREMQAIFVPHTVETKATLLYSSSTHAAACEARPFMLDVKLNPSSKLVCAAAVTGLFLLPCSVEAQTKGGGQKTNSGSTRGHSAKSNSRTAKRLTARTRRRQRRRLGRGPEIRTARAPRRMKSRLCEKPRRCWKKPNTIIKVTEPGQCMPFTRLFKN